MMFPKTSRSQNIPAAGLLGQDDECVVTSVPQPRTQSTPAMEMSNEGDGETKRGWRAERVSRENFSSRYTLRKRSRTSRSEGGERALNGGTRKRLRTDTHHLKGTQFHPIEAKFRGRTEMPLNFPLSALDSMNHDSKHHARRQGLMSCSVGPNWNPVDAGFLWTLEPLSWYLEKPNCGHNVGRTRTCTCASES